MAAAFPSTALSDALVILGAAGIVIPAFARFRISPVIGFILVGVLVGPAGLGALVPRYPWLYHVTISDPHAIEPFAEFGIVLLLFSIGLELSFRRLWEMRKQVFGIGAAELFGAGAVIALGLHLIGQSWNGAIGLGLALALSSTALVLPLVGTTGRVGRPAFAMLLFEDLALVPIIFALSAMSPATGNGLGALGTVAINGLLAILALFVLGRIVLPKLFAQAARAKNPELFLAASLLVAIVASLATTAAGLSPIVGALIAGVLIAETPYHHEVEAITKPFQGLALGVFLLSVGMRVDLAAIAQQWQGFVAATVGVMLAKVVVTTALLRFSGETSATSAETGVLMASPSETTLIVLGSAGAAGLILPETAAFWTSVTAIGLTVTPLLARLGRTMARRIDHRAPVDSPDDDEAPPGTVIIGFGRVGRTVADVLRQHDKRFIAVDADADGVLAAQKDGYPVMFGDVARHELVDRLRLGHADALVLTMDDPVLSVALAKKVRSWVPNLPIIARARDADHAAQLYRAGVTDAVPETLESSLQLAEALLVDVGVAVGPAIASIHEQRDIMRKAIKDAASLDREPRIRRVRRKEEVGD